MASGFGHVNTNLPEPLFFLCLKSLANNLDVLCKSSCEGYALRENVTVPSVFWKLIIEAYQKNGNDINDSFANIFKNDTKTKLKSLNLRNSSISGSGLKNFLRHNLYELTLIDCHSISYESFNQLFEYAKNLEMLNIDSGLLMTESPENSSILLCRILRNINQKATNLKHLVLRQLFIWPYFFLDNIKLNHEFRVLMKKLEILDLSNSLGIDCFYYNMSNPANLHTLILFDTRNLEENDTILHICTLKTLVVLDISQSNYSPNHGLFKNGNRTLERIVKSLPKLMSLDISGTNMAGTAEHSVGESLSGKHSDIPGLKSRVDNPLKFLGLYHTMYDACRRQIIPAKTISGHANEEQLIISAGLYMDRPSQIKNILYDIQCLIKELQWTKIDIVLEIILEALASYTNAKSIQMMCISTIKDIVVLYKNSIFLNNINIQNKIISALLTGIHFHNYNNDMIRQGYDTIRLLARSDHARFTK